MLVGDETYVSLTPFHIGEPGQMVGQTNNNSNHDELVTADINAILVGRQVPIILLSCFFSLEVRWGL